MPPQTSSEEDPNPDSRQGGNMEAQNCILREGFLLKKTRSVFKHWNRHWFIVKNNQLLYKKRFKRDLTVLMEDLQQCTIQHYEDTRHLYSFQVVSPTRSCTLQAESKVSRQAWIQAIQNVADETESDTTRKFSDGEIKLGVLPRASPALLLEDDISQGEVLFDAVEKSGEIDEDEQQDDTTTNTNTSSDSLNLTEIFESQYTIAELLGRGGFGSVYKGVCKADGEKVAFKFVKKSYQPFTTIPGETDLRPLEVALMQMVSRPPCTHVLRLLKWFDTPQQYILVLERPDPCMDLMNLLTITGRLSKQLTRHIMWRVVQGAHHCLEHGVLHRDIKLQNVLLNLETLEVKLIDFGCGDLLKETPYSTFDGTKAYAPPEWILKRKYRAGPLTVWSLGVLMFGLVCGHLPFRNEQQIAHGHLVFAPGVSKACRHLIKKFLKKKPSMRPSIKNILQDKFFQNERVD